MKILYICYGELINNKFKSSSWIEGLVWDMKNIETIDLSIAFSSFEGKNREVKKIDRITYHSYPLNTKDIIKYNEATEQYLIEIIKESNPDIIHIFGTEYPFCLATVNACKKLGFLDKLVVSIQGLTSAIYKHYCNGLSNSLIKSFTLRDLLRFDNIYLQVKKMYRRGENEIAALQNVKHVIGRTTWDEAVTSQINPNIQYHFCNETLRPSFYDKKWDINSCERYSIFFSQSYYPVKGFHYMLEAMPEIIKKYPEAHIYTTGKDVMDISSVSNKIKEASYDRYLRKIIQKYKLEKHITYLGYLSEEEICERYLNSHVFVSASTIENSPNSLGEAMLLGVPSVASDVGGVKDMLVHNTDGFIYQSDAPYMLAYYVSELFKNENKANEFSNNSHKHASMTHNKKKNIFNLLEIYIEIGGNKDETI